MGTYFRRIPPVAISQIMTTCEVEQDTSWHPSTCEVTGGEGGERKRRVSCVCLVYNVQQIAAYGTQHKAHGTQHTAHTTHTNSGMHVSPALSSLPGTHHVRSHTPGPVRRDPSLCGKGFRLLGSTTSRTYDIAVEHKERKEERKKERMSVGNSTILQ